MANQDREYIRALEATVSRLLGELHARGADLGVFIAQPTCMGGDIMPCFDTLKRINAKLDTRESQAELIGRIERVEKALFASTPDRLAK